MFISPENKGTGLELEIARTPNDIRLYVNVFSVEPFPCSESPVPVIVIIDDNRFDILADRFAGGQRFLLPAEIYSPILAALSSDKTVTLVLGRYRSAIIGLGFPAAFEKLNKI